MGRQVSSMEARSGGHRLRANWRIIQELQIPIPPEEMDSVMTVEEIADMVSLQTTCLQDRRSGLMAQCQVMTD